MNRKIFRKKKEDNPVLAICYDFDKTLSPDDMQAQGYIQSVYSKDVASFWKESNQLAEDNEMDTNLAYMYKMVMAARGKIGLSKKTLEEYGGKVKLFRGVDKWFDRIKKYGKKKGVIIEHYIISSGLKEMIQGTSVARKGAFEKIYASSFLYDEQDVPIWPAQVVNYTNKTQFLFRIEKGILDVNDSGVNDSFSPEDIRIPFRNIVYIGDSDTDIPCMKLVNTYGGHSIGVYNQSTLDKSKVFKMMNDNRIKYFAPADYSVNSELDKLVKSIIDRTAYNESLENIHYKCKVECKKNTFRNEDIIESQNRMSLILSLRGSVSFAATHEIMKKLLNIENWSEEEIEMLFDVALDNSQVRYILNDDDVKLFYKNRIKQYGKHNKRTDEIESYFS